MHAIFKEILNLLLRYNYTHAIRIFSKFIFSPADHGVVRSAARQKQEVYFRLEAATITLFQNVDLLTMIIDVRTCFAREKQRYVFLLIIYGGVKHGELETIFGSKKWEKKLNIIIIIMYRSL